VNRFSWKAGAQYDLARKTMVYATVSRGFKGGQIATPTYPPRPMWCSPKSPPPTNWG
jgi:iron complex outermembrane receptor protein